jgi:predicted RNA-binding protein Jag
VQVSTKDLERPARGNDRPQRDRSVEPQTRREENRGANREEGRGRDRGARNDRPEKPARTDKPVQQEKPAAERKPERGERQGNAPREAAAKQEQPREQRPPRERGERGGRDRNDRGGNRERSEERPAQQAANKPREERKRDERPPRREPQPPREPREPRADRASHNEDKAAFAQISDEHGHQAASLLAEIISAMGIQAEVAFKREPESAARLEVKSEDGALLIGRKGATLGALQYLINRMISQSEDGESLERVVVDVEGYLDRRRESLEDLARSMAAKARETGRSMRLKPMSPQERRIIHVTLQEDPDVRTYSQGEALYRSVVISPSAEVAVAIRSAGGGTGGERRDGGRGNQNANNESTSGTTPNAGSGRPLRNGRRIRPRGGRRNETDVDAGAFGD